MTAVKALGCSFLMAKAQACMLHDGRQHMQQSHHMLYPSISISVHAADCGCMVQTANFARANKVWRHVCYKGGVVPQNEIVTQLQAPEH